MEKFALVYFEHNQNVLPLVVMCAWSSADWAKTSNGGLPFRRKYRRFEKKLRKFSAFLILHFSDMSVQQCTRKEALNSQEELKSTTTLHITSNNHSRKQVQFVRLGLGSGERVEAIARARMWSDG